MVAALIAGMFVGMQSIALLPLLVGQSIAGFGLSEQQAGYLVAVQLGVGAISGFTLSLRLHRLDRRSSFTLGVALSIAGNLLSLAAARNGNILLLFLSRALAGLGEGMVLATVSAVAAGTAKPLRTFGIMNIGFGLLTSGAYLLTPRLIEAYGTVALFANMGCVGTVALFLIPAIPRYSSAVPAVQNGLFAGFSARGWYALLGYTLFMLIAGGTWGFSQRVGAVSAQLDTVTLGKITSVAMILIFLGPYLANLLAERCGWGVSLCVACLTYMVVSITFATLATASAFAFGVGLHVVVSSFMSTIAPTYLARLDEQGCLAAAGSAFMPLGAAFGPSLLSLAMLYFPSYTAIGYVGVVLLSVSMLFFVLSVRQRTVAMTVFP